MDDTSCFEGVLKSVDNALSLLTEYEGAVAGNLPVPPLSSLLEQCEAVLADYRPNDPIRTIHHFACTGGTVMSKVISAMPNTVLLSEIDPLSTIMIRRDAPLFTPTDLIAALRHSFRTADEDLLVDIFLQGLRVLADRLRSGGRSLVLRDHAHSQFCVRRDPASRPSLREILTGHFDLLSIVTIRHPLDSYASLVANGWHKHFEPSDIETYAQRYALFLDAHDGLPLIKFEDFAAAPSDVSAAMCQYLALPWSEISQSILSVVKMSGDSGRRSDFIAQPSRREIPTELLKAAQNSESYHNLCHRLNYEP